MATYIETYDINGLRLTQPQHFTEIHSTETYPDALAKLFARVQKQARDYTEARDVMVSLNHKTGETMQDTDAKIEKWGRSSGVVKPKECYCKIVKDGHVVRDTLILKNPLYQ